jgi:hypothetical protein
MRSTSFSDISNIVLTATIPLQQMTIAGLGGGTELDNRIQWTVDSLPALQSRTFSYDVSLLPSLKDGDIVRTSAAATVAGVLAQTTNGEVHVIARLPQAGADDQFFAPLEDTTKNLSPY